MESFIGKVTLCSSCKQMKIIKSEETMNDEILSKFCNECHEILHKIVKCKRCEREMPNRDYIKHLIDYHLE